MGKDYSTAADKKQRWAGLLEIPIVSKIQRGLLDGFRARRLGAALESLVIPDVLEIGCGLGDYCRMKTWRYFGLDNSFWRLVYGQRHAPQAAFIQGDALNLPFQAHAFTATLFAGTAHHFTDESIEKILKQMARVSRKYIIISDIVRFCGQNSLSRFFYDLDRGAFLRTASDMEQLIQSLDTHQIVFQKTFKSFPGIYHHAVFVLESL